MAPSMAKMDYSEAGLSLHKKAMQLTCLVALSTYSAAQIA